MDRNDILTKVNSNENLNANHDIMLRREKIELAARLSTALGGEPTSNIDKAISIVFNADSINATGKNGTSTISIPKDYINAQGQTVPVDTKKIENTVDSLYKKINPTTLFDSIDVDKLLKISGLTGTVIANKLSIDPDKIKGNESLKSVSKDLSKEAKDDLLSILNNVDLYWDVQPNNTISFKASGKDLRYSETIYNFHLEDLENFDHKVFDIRKYSADEFSDPRDSFQVKILNWIENHNLLSK